jgi:IMP dehydrogenase/GMP reductase
MKLYVRTTVRSLLPQQVALKIGVSYQGIALAIPLISKSIATLGAAL